MQKSKGVEMVRPARLWGRKGMGEGVGTGVQKSGEVEMARPSPPVW